MRLYSLHPVLLLLLLLLLVLALPAPSGDIGCPLIKEEQTAQPYVLYYCTYNLPSTTNYQDYHLERMRVTVLFRRQKIGSPSEMAEVQMYY